MSMNSFGNGGHRLRETGDVVEYRVGSLCTYSLPAQTIGNVSYENQGGYYDQRAVGCRNRRHGIKSTKTGSVFAREPLKTARSTAASR